MPITRTAAAKQPGSGPNCPPSHWPSTQHPDLGQGQRANHLGWQKFVVWGPWRCLLSLEQLCEQSPPLVEVDPGSGMGWEGLPNGHCRPHRLRTAARHLAPVRTPAGIGAAGHKGQQRPGARRREARPRCLPCLLGSAAPWCSSMPWGCTAHQKGIQLGGQGPTPARALSNIGRARVGNPGRVGGDANPYLFSLGLGIL